MSAYMMAKEVWVSVKVYGPQVEIERLKTLCIVPDTSLDAAPGGRMIDFGAIRPLPSGREGDLHAVTQAWGTTCEPWNFRDWPQEGRGTYAFAFDAAQRFPLPVFERLAVMFPWLAFECDCIGGDDEFMGFGWFNGPPGGEAFHMMSVPADHWDEGRSGKRGAAAQLRHEARVEALRRAALEASPE